MIVRFTGKRKGRKTRNQTVALLDIKTELAITRYENAVPVRVVRAPKRGKWRTRLFA